MADAIEEPGASDDARPADGANDRPLVPEGFETELDFVEDARKQYRLDGEHDKDNRDEGIDDLEFEAGDQWTDEAKEQRGQSRPCLVVNDMPQYVGQIVGDRRMNQAAIKVVPSEDGDRDIAEIRSGLIRNIEKVSRASRVYAKAFEDGAACGVGNFQIELDWAGDDVFDQDIFIREIPNQFAVTWDRQSTESTGRDARRCFVDDVYALDDFEEKWPHIDSPKNLGPDLLASCQADGWIREETVRVTSYWRMIERPRTLALMKDGSVYDITDHELGESLADIAQDDRIIPSITLFDAIATDPKTGQPRTREAKKRFAHHTLVTGHAILEKPYELPLTRLPVIRVTGRVIQIGEKRVRFGVIRFAKDPARLRNYWRSVAAETLALSPKGHYLAEADAVKGREQSFREGHVSNDPLRIYNSGKKEPRWQDPPAFPSALTQEAQMNVQDMRDVTGIHEASLGIRSNETSGKAIQERRRQGDVATVIYHDHMNDAIEEAGDVINQLIPLVYDTARTIRVLGEDGEERLQRINDPSNPDAVNIGQGKYDTTITTGPTYATKRIEAAESMLEAVRVMPQLMEIAGDLVAKAQDWPGAEEFAERLRRGIPAHLLGDGEDGQPAIPPALEEQIQALTQRLQEIEAENEELKREDRVEFGKLMLESNSQMIEAYRAETDRLEAITDKDFPLPAGADTLFEPLVLKTIGEASDSPDVAPGRGGPVM